MSNTGEWDCTYKYYYDGDRNIETRNGTDLTIKQQVWGGLYVDELVQEAVGTSASLGSGDPIVRTNYWVCQDANFNVLGIVDEDGVLTERYEYTPYGQRTVYFSPGGNDVGCYAVTSASRRPSLYMFPHGLCEFGHQGLMHDEETGLVYNRFRNYSPNAAQYLQRDPAGYISGSNQLQYESSSPDQRLDAPGTWDRDGHFVTAFGVARICGWNMHDASEFAYYSQYPDQVADLDAVPLSADITRELLSHNYKEAVRNTEIQDLIHSLHGGGAADVKKRQECLKKLLKDKSLNYWEKGIVNHALGDAFAHVRPDGSAYPPLTGHASNPKADDIATHMSAYEDYVSNLAQAIGCDCNDGDTTSKLRSLEDSAEGKTYGGFLSDVLRRNGFPRWLPEEPFNTATEALGWSSGGVDVSRYRPTKADIDGLLKKIMCACK